jgi:hypothetical protein
MIYRLLETNMDGIKIYARIDEDGLCRLTCTEDNPEFLKFIEDGGVPLPAEGA